jgi:hypothetical protein
MERFFDAAYRMTRSAWEVSFEACKVVDLIWSVVIAVGKYAGGAILGVGLAVVVERVTFSWVYDSLFEPEAFARHMNLGQISWFIQHCPLISAFIIFAAGQSVVVVIVTIALEALLRFKLTFVLRTREVDQEGHYSPIEDGATDADDPLAF